MKAAAIRLAAAALATAMVAAPASAQGAKFVGKWECQISFAQMNPDGSIYSGWHRDFMMTVQSNGQFQAEGVETGVGGRMPFSVQGKWMLDNVGMFGAQGQGTLMTPVSGPQPDMFGFFANMEEGDRRMSFMNPLPDPTQRYVMTRNNYLCQKVG